MPNLFKSLISRGDDDEELDLEFDINSPESACFELPPDRRDNQVLTVWGSPSSGKTNSQETYIWLSSRGNGNNHAAAYSCICRNRINYIFI